MPVTQTQRSLDALRDVAKPLTGEAADYDDLLEAIGDRQFVLLGEASHGTQEFYRTRAEITRRLITELGFDAVIVEGDWPDVYRVNRYVMHDSDDADAVGALGDFTRFPRWMWRNREVQRFVEWLHEYNAGVPAMRRAGMYGMDLYSLHRSAAAVIEYLDDIDPDAAVRARERYGCLDHSGDPQGYGYSVAMSVQKSCEDEVVDQLQEMLRERTQQLDDNGLLDDDAQFVAEMNARVVRNAETYYRNMFASRISTWNLRDQHMAEVLFALHEQLTRKRGRQARIAVWAHNSHLGDARATQMSRYGELNLGQLVRERGRDNAFLVGFTTHTGHVTAARDWDAPAEHRWVRPSLEGSIERLLKETELERFYLPLAEKQEDLRVLRERHLERAIGVIYRPETERQSHYFTTALADQFDAVFHLDETSALEPLEGTDQWNRKETPETWPFGV